MDLSCCTRHAHAVTVFHALIISFEHESSFCPSNTAAVAFNGVANTSKLQDSLSLSLSLSLCLWNANGLGFKELRRIYSAEQMKIT